MFADYCWKLSGEVFVGTAKHASASAGTWCEHLRQGRQHRHSSLSLKLATLILLALGLVAALDHQRLPHLCRPQRRLHRQGRSGLGIRIVIIITTGVMLGCCAMSACADGAELAW